MAVSSSNATEMAFYAEKLAQKDHDYSDLQSSFNKFKLKTKVKLDQLKKDVYAYCGNQGIHISDEKNNALLLIRLTESDLALEESRKEVDSLSRDLARKQLQLNDHMILIRNLEEQLRASVLTSDVELEERKRSSQHVDMDRVYQQMRYKDERIIELNNVILEKERHILDLQEMCREQGEVANSKNQAMKIVQKKFEELEGRGRREVGTETESWQWPSSSSSSSRRDMATSSSRMPSRSLSPGKAVVLRAGGSSPPPLDPSEVDDPNVSYRDEDEDLPSTSSGFHGRNLDQESTLRNKKQRKRVTFDLPPSASGSTVQLNNVTADEEIANVVISLTEENSRLLAELDQQRIQFQRLVEDSATEMARVTRDGKSHSLKARAVAQGRIKDLEDKMAELNRQYLQQAERLQTDIETLRSTREWEVEQNAVLREQIAQMRDKNHKLNEELDASEQGNRELEGKLEQSEELMSRMVEDLAEAEGLVVFLEEQKHDILDDIERLKEALIAQDQFIEILEADTVIYEEHIGILRESLGASKVDHRALIRSKAFETKLKALEKEKEQIDRRSNEERIRTKALDTRCKMLEEENEKLMEKICEHEMGTRDDTDMVETCKQLELRLREADEEMSHVRADFEVRIETANVELQRKSNEMERLLEELNRSRVEMTMMREEWSAGLARDVHQGTGASSSRSQPDMRGTSGYPSSGAQTQLMTEREDPMPRIQLENQVEALESELAESRRRLEGTSDELHNVSEALQERTEELDRISGANFELNERNSNLQREVDRLGRQLESSRIVNDDLQQSVNSLNAELKEVQAASENQWLQITNELQEEMKATKAELEHARLGLSETAAVKKELEKIKEELVRERTSGRAQWEEVCKKVLDAEANDPTSRKNSMEVQHQQYMIAYEDKIVELQEELKSAKEKIEADKVEKKKLKAAVKQLRERQATASQQGQQDQLHVEAQQVNVTAASVHVQHVSNAPVSTQAPPPDLLVTAPQTASVEENKKEMRDPNVSQRLQDLEIEARLSGELNVELGRAMVEMEEKIEHLEGRQRQLLEEVERSTMELKLHEMLADELSQELEESKQREKDLRDQLESSVDDISQQAQQRVDEDEQNQLKEELEQLREDLEDANARLGQYETLRWKEKAQTEKVHADEVTLLMASVESARRSISDLEARQRALEDQLSSSHGQLIDMRNAMEHKSAECAHLQSEVERLTAAAASTSSHHVVESMRHQEHLQQSSERSGRSTLTIEQRETSIMGATQGQRSPPAQAHVHDGTVLDTTNEASSSTEATAYPSITASAAELITENLVLRQCLNESSEMQNQISQDVAKLNELKSELEDTVTALKGEIWSLNGQLKASTLDRENLQDRVVTLDTWLAEEKKRADALDVELSEQVELTEKSQRQAAEAENESNRRLAECLEMETRREELEKAYVQLTDYYNQLQAAYNVLYEKVHSGESAGQVAAGETQGAAPFEDQEVLRRVNAIMEELGLDVVEGMSILEKLSLIHETMKARLAEVEESRRAIMEQRRVHAALQERLSEMEEEAGGENGAAALRERLGQVQGDLDWKEDECQSLGHKIREMQELVDTLTASKEESDSLAATRLRTELAILAARLTTRQADVDALFRANADLAHTNVRLQNELDEREERDGQEERQQRERYETELSQLRDTERRLMHTVRELEEKLQASEKQLKEASSSNREEERLQAAGEPEEEQGESWGWGQDDAVSPATASSARVEELEAEIRALRLTSDEAVDTRAELKRLEEVEKMLNHRISQLEDQLEEKEERVQDIEDELLEERKKMEQVEKELEILKKVPIEETKNEEKEDEKGDDDGDDWGWGKEESSTSAPATSANNEVVAQLEAQLEEERRHRERLENKVADQEAELAEEVERLESEMQEKENELKDAMKKAQQKYDQEATVMNKTINELKESLSMKEQELVDAEQQLVSMNSRKVGEKAPEETVNMIQAPLLAAAPRSSEDDNGWSEDWNEESEAPAVEQNVAISELENERQLRQDAEELVDGLKRLVTQLREQITQLEQKCESDSTTAAAKLEEELEQKNEEVRECKQQIDDMKNQLTETRDGLRAAKELAMSLQMEESEKQAHLLNQAEEQQRTIEELQNACGELETKSHEVESLRSQLDAAEERFSALQNHAEDSEGLRKELEEVTVNMEILKNKLKLLETESADREEALQKELDQADAREEALKQELEESTSRVASLQEELEDLKATVVEIQKELEEARAGAGSKTEEWGWGEEEKEEEKDTEQELRLLKEESERAEEERRRLAEELERSQQRAEEISIEMDLIRTDRREAEEKMQQATRDAEDAQSQIQALSADVDAHLARIEELEVERDTAQAELVQRRRELDLVERESMQRSTDEVAELSRATTELLAVRQRLEQMEKQNELLKDCEGRLVDSLDESEEAKERLEKEAKRLQIVVNTLEKERNELESQLENSQTALEELKSQLEESRKASVNRQEQQATPVSSSQSSAASEEELRVKTELLQLVQQEKNSLSVQLESVKEQLKASEENRQKIKHAYDQLRSRLASRRLAATPPSASSAAASRDSSRRSSLAIHDVEEIVEEPSSMTVNLPLQTSEPYVSQERVLLSLYREAVEDLLASLQRYQQGQTSRDREISDLLASTPHDIMGKKKPNRRPSANSLGGVVTVEDGINALPTVSSDLLKDDETAAIIKKIKEAEYQRTEQADVQALLKRISTLEAAYVASAEATRKTKKVMIEAAENTTRRIQLLEEEVAQRQDSLEEKTNELDGYKEQYEEMKHENNQIRSTHVDLMVDRSRCQKLYEDALKRIVVQDDEMRELRGLEDTVKLLTEKMEHMKFEEQRRKIREDELKMAVERLREQLEQAETEKQQAFEEAEKTMQRLTEVMKEKQILEDDAQKAKCVADDEDAFKKLEVMLETERENHAAIVSSLKEENNERLQQAEMDLAACREEIATMDSQIARLTVEKHEHNKTLKVRLDELEQEKSVMYKELEELRLSNSGKTLVEAELEQAKKQLEELKLEKELLDKTLREKSNLEETTLAAMEADLMKANSVLENLQREKEELEKKSESERALLVTMEVELAQTKMKLEEMKHEKELVNVTLVEKTNFEKTTLETMEAELIQTKKELDESRKEKEKIKLRLPSVLGQVQQLQIDHEEDVKRFEADIEKEKAKTHEAEQKLKKAEAKALKKLNTLNSSIESLTKELEENKQLLAAMNSNNQVLQQENRSIKKRQEEFSQKEWLLGTLQSSLVDSVEESRRLRVEVESEQEKAEQLQKKLEESGRQISELDQSLLAAIEDAAVLRKEKDSLKAAAEEKEKKVLKLQQLLSDYEEDLIRLHEEVRVLKARIEEQEEKIEDTERLRQTLLEKEEVSTMLEQQIEMLRKELAESEKNVSMQSVNKEAPENKDKLENEVVAHLRDDNVRLERELFRAHEQLSNIQNDMENLQRTMEQRDLSVLAARNEAQRLTSELDQSRFECEQLIKASSNGKDAAARILELERSLALMRAEHSEKMEQMLEDIRTYEERVRLADETEEQRRSDLEEMTEKMESWRRRFELAAQENESFGRQIDEVRHLEAALHKSSEEVSNLMSRLADSRAETANWREEKASLEAEIRLMRQQADDRAERLRQAGEAKMENTIRIVSMETQIANLTRERDELLASRADTTTTMSPLQNPPILANDDDAGPAEIHVEEQHREIRLVMPDPVQEEISTLREQLERAQARVQQLESSSPEDADDDTSSIQDTLWNDFVAPSTRLISASAPLPSLLDRLSRRIRLLSRHRSRAVQPILRMVLAGYFVFLHFLLLQCWFF